MYKKWKTVYLVFVIIGVLVTLPAHSASIFGDTQGKVSSVNLKPVVNSVHRLNIRFSTIENDRWNCHSAQGFIEITDSSPFVSLDQLQMILGMALAAQASGRSLAIDSPSSNPCNMANMAWIISD